MSHRNEVQEVRKMIIPDEFAGKTKDQVIEKAKELLAEQQGSEGANSLDSRIRNGNIHTLQKLIDDYGVVKNGSGEIIRSEAQIKAEAAAAEQKKNDDRKAAIMHKIRSSFAGTDTDFDRLKDRLYDDYLLGNEDEDARRARARVRPNL